jgi:di/tricarboxylate transporter
MRFIQKTKTTNFLSIKLLFTLIFILLGISVAIFKPFTNLGEMGQIMLGTIISALAVWIFRPGSGTFTAGAAVILIGGIVAGVPIPDLTNGFSSPSMWLLIPAMFLGSALQFTGLGKRIVYALFTRMELSYIKILFGWLIIGILFSLLTPSITIRILILTSIAVSVADACLLEKMSKGRSLIILSAWSVGIFPSIAWHSGSLFGPVFTAFLPYGPMREMATEQIWFQFMGVPWLLFSIAFLAVLYVAFKPEIELTMTYDTRKKMYDDLGPLCKKEKGCLVAFIFLLAGLVLQLFLPITTLQVLLCSMFLMLFLNVTSVKDISTGINWDVIIFFGMMMSFVHIFEFTGLSDWMAPTLTSLLAPIAFSPLVFIVAFFGICLLLRLLDITQGWVTSGILAIATPMLFSNFGLHPMMSTMVFVAASNLFIFRYNQPWIVQVESVCGESGWNPQHLRTAALLYIVAATVMLVFSRFYWEFVGLI